MIIFCFFFVLFCFLFQLLYLTNNTLYITVDNRKKNGKERQITIKPGSYTVGSITNYKKTEYALHYCTYRYKTGGKEKFRDDGHIMHFSRVRERTDN